MKKILILGCEGMAGHVVKKYMESLGHYDVWGLARRVSSKKNIINLNNFLTLITQRIR